MEDKVVNAINSILKKNKCNRKEIYEHLLQRRIVEPGTERLVYEILEHGLENKLIDQSKIIRFKKKRGKLPKTFSMEQLIKLFDECNNPKLAIAIWLGFFCGLRINEVCCLKIRDINLDTRKVSVLNSKNPNRSKYGYGTDRIVTIPQIAISPLRKWLDIMQGGEWLLPSMQSPNSPIRTKTIHEQFRWLLTRCNLSELESTTPYRARNHGRKKDMKKGTYVLRFHSLRHTYATYLLDQGVPLVNIKQCLGHERMDTTLIYAKVSDKKTEEFVNNAFLDPIRQIRQRNTMSDSMPMNRTEPISSISAEEIIKQRLAKGEIDILSFRRLMTELNPNNSVTVIHTVKEMEQ